MKRLSKVVSVFAVLSLLAGCAVWPRAGNNAALYTDVSSPVTVAPNDRQEPLRYGQACTSSILGIYTSGRSTVANAVTNASITEIITVEEQFRHILFGAYAQYCTVVGGY